MEDLVKEVCTSCVYFLILKYVIIAAHGTSLSQSVCQLDDRSVYQAFCRAVKKCQKVHGVLKNVLKMLVDNFLA